MLRNYCAAPGLTEQILRGRGIGLQVIRGCFMELEPEGRWRGSCLQVGYSKQPRDAETRSQKQKSKQSTLSVKKIMKKLKTLLAMAGCLTVLALSTATVSAQRNGGGRANFDPAAMRQQQMDRIKTAMDVTDDAEWKVLEGAIGKVLDAQQEARAGRGGFGGGAGGRRNRGGAQAADAAGGATNPPAGGNNRRGGGTPDPDVEALQAAIDAKAPTDEIKAKLGKVRESAKAKEAKVVTAQGDLQKLLSARQEAVAVIFGLLK